MKRRERRAPLVAGAPRLVFASSLFVLCVASALARETSVILPNDFTLAGPAARQLLVVERIENKHLVGQVTNAQFTSSSPKIVRIENGVALPVANGTATLTAKAGRESISTKVTVTDMDQPFAWSFRNHVQPVLAKAGCSSGACHGAAAGQNGFKLSLRGYDDDGDFLTLTRQALGRRVVPSDPGRSLLLLKPTAAIPHKGGQRFATNSLEYQILAEWIASGTPAPKQDDPRIRRLEILPAHVILKPGMAQQLTVRAHFSDGHAEDVTRWVKYTVANAAVSQVDDFGNVKVVGHGEGAITAWYLSRLAIATITAPYDQKISPSVFTKARRRNFMDELVLEKLQELNLPPSPPCTDAEFIRRAFLDTLGLLPTPEETRAFLADVAPDVRRGTERTDTSESAFSRRRLQKRDELIESLLQRPEFVDYWSYKWSDLLLVSSGNLTTAPMWAYYHWIRSHVAANTPWDVLVRELVTATGSTLENGAANFYVLHDEPTKMAETVSAAFLGMSINCAKCHNHPMEKWTNDEYFGFANLFARVRAKNGAAADERIIFPAAEGDLVQPLTGRPQPPRPLEAKPIALTAKEDRRLPLADWLTSPQNPYFSRSIVNRVWANFFGVGLVEAVDDLRMTNPASNEKLLSATATFLAQNKFNLKALMRAILQSETYQRSSRPLPQNKDDTRFYSRFYPRRLMAEVLLDAVSQVTEVPTPFRIDTRNANRGLGATYPLGWRALQLPDANVDSYFLKSFGRPERVNTCVCERTDEPSMSQALHIANGDTVNQKLAARDNRIEKLLAEKMPDEQLITEACLSALSRPPAAAEKTAMLKTLASVPDAERRQVLEDIFWGLLSSREFLFNH